METQQQYEERMLSPALHLAGKATDHIWCMEDVTGYIGIRFDCGDAGTVYVTKEQARLLIEDLNSFV